MNYTTLNIYFLYLVDITYRYIVNHVYFKILTFEGEL